ncbi:peritrophin-44 [Haematobia irritans]|uniref:peritrophin-44 n=1 Tax=Haematobia irritans TaxID=7368 RepID=UPI003F50C742
MKGHIITITAYLLSGISNFLAVGAQQNVFGEPDIVSDDFTELCRLFKDNTLISFPGSCDKYIECHSNGMGMVHTCPGSFDVETQKCVDSVSNNKLCDNPCVDTTLDWVADPTNCHAFFYCYDGFPYWGHCDDGYHFDEKTQMCIHSTSSNCVDVSHLCQLLPDKTKFRNENDCSAYYECADKKKDKTPSPKTCSKTYFDVQSQACIDKSMIACTAHPIPSGLCQTKSGPYVGYKADQATCRGYFYCRNLGAVPDLEPIWGQCPEGKFFDESVQACANPIDVKCEYNRCEGRGNLMVSSAKNNCHNYLICENSQVKEERTCARDYFFDELYQACVPDIIYYNCCDIK